MIVGGYKLIWSWDGLQMALVGVGLGLLIALTTTQAPRTQAPRLLDASLGEDMRALFSAAQELWAKEIPTYKPAQLVLGGSERRGPYWSHDGVSGTVHVPYSYVDGRNRSQVEHAVLHELGHHAQHMQGIVVLDRDTGPKAPQTLHELQADCYGGWAAATLGLMPSDMEDVVRAAELIGDDKMGARPYEYTHGSAEARRAATERGIASRGAGGWQRCRSQTFGPWR